MERLCGAFASKRASDDLSDARCCVSGGASNADLLPAGRAGGLAVGGRPSPGPEAAFGEAEASIGLEGVVVMVAAALGRGEQQEMLTPSSIFGLLVVKPCPIRSWSDWD